MSSLNDKSCTTGRDGGAYSLGGRQHSIMTELTSRCHHLLAVQLPLSSGFLIWPGGGHYMDLSGLW